MAERYALRTLLRDIAGIVVEEEQPSRILELIAPLLERFAQQGSGLPPGIRESRSEQPRSYLLHEEGDGSFFVIARVLPADGDTGVHFHAAWRASILLEGEQEQTTYRRADEGGDLTCADLAEASRERRGSAALSASPDGVYHRTRNSRQTPAIALAVLAGTPDDHPYYRYDSESRTLRRAELAFVKLSQ
jgi:predicted metal-dependent enzyme (double-stranded beta helix superfamily)